MFNRIQIRWSLWPFPTKPFSVYACYQLCSINMKSCIMENCLQKVTGRSAVIKETLDLCSTDHHWPFVTTSQRWNSLNWIRDLLNWTKKQRGIVFLSVEFCFPYWQIADDYWSEWSLEFVRITVASANSLHTKMACEGISVDSCTDSHIFYSDTMNSIWYCDDIRVRYIADTVCCSYGCWFDFLSYCLNSQGSHCHTIFRIWNTVSCEMTITITCPESQLICIGHAMEIFIFIHWPSSEHFWTISVSSPWLSADIQNCHGWS